MVARARRVALQPNTKTQKQNFKTLPRRTAEGRGKLSEFCFFVIGSLLLFVIRI